MTRGMTRGLARPARIAAALLVALALGFVPALAPGLAPGGTALAGHTAPPRLEIVTATRYDVRPDQGRVAVTSRLTATNHMKNTATRRFFFRTAVLTVLPGTSNFKLSGGSGSPRVTVGKRTDAYTNLRLDFGANLAAGRSTTLTLTFDLMDPGGAPDRATRISPSLVSFAAWAYATPNTHGSTVDVRMPEGYAVTVGRGPLEEPVADGDAHERWESGPIQTPLDYVADVVADRPGDLVETALEVPLAEAPASIVLRSWPDDPEWRDRISSLVERALPVLEREIGVPWPVDGPLGVEEALVRTTGGYAGLFAPAERRIEIAYAASDGVVLHELAHAWFNGRLVADRWVAEGFASYYAALAAAELGIDPDSPAPPPDPEAGGLPLNDWGPSGSESEAAETFGYAASLSLAQAIAERAGADAMHAVWERAAGGIGAYQPVVAGEGGDPVPVPDLAPEPAEGPPDWRGLLDLVEDETGEAFADLWLEHVARPADAAAIEERAAAREAYASSVELAGDWQLPAATRAALRAWQFETAEELLQGVDAVLAQRAALEATSAAAGLTLPNRLRTAFEGQVGVEAAAAEARAEQTVVDAITRARASQPVQPGVVEQVMVGLGLLGIRPEEDLAAAGAHFAAGDIEAAYASALQAEAAWTAAPSVGRSRIVSAALLLIALLLLVGLVRQHRRRRATAATPEGSAATTGGAATT